eukprot:TRINITY_DN8420_c1_g1_i1.p1 TRINITY_DN8420_c1_g1~~TRINITY_DN8420_c1_g1_i1.p1  ORF type:complete len:351 (+),score=66.02 TRINITY_DN8420_c1_g1_i1:172-1224(+)
MLKRTCVRYVSPGGADKRSGVSTGMSQGWGAGARMRANSIAGNPQRENVARGRRSDPDDLGLSRPKFDLMGKLQEWAKAKDAHKNMDKYFYLEFLVDMEGFPEEMRDVRDLTQQEHLNLRLLSLAEERKFWKTYLFYVEQYEWENTNNITNAVVPSQTACIEHALRMARIASPAFLKEFLSNGLDDQMLAGLSPSCHYRGCNFPNDFLNLLDGAAVYQMLKSYGITEDQVILFLQSLASLKTIPVKVLDKDDNVVESKTLHFDEIPTLPSISEAFGLEGGHSRWFYDVRGFFSTPGRMLFEEYAYQNFILDWYFSRAYAFGVPGSRCIHIRPKPSPEQVQEARRGWFHVL